MVDAPIEFFQKTFSSRHRSAAFCKMPARPLISLRTTKRLFGTETIKIALVSKSAWLCMFTDGDDWSKFPGATLADLYTRLRDEYRASVFGLDPNSPL